MKKFTSILICVALIIGVLSVGSFSAATTKLSIEQAIDRYENKTGEKIETTRYYFLMPNGKNGEICDDEDYDTCGKLPPSWYNENADSAGIYWWDCNTINPESWPGFEMYRGDSDSVYFADIPSSVEVMKFNNYFDRGFANWWDDPIFYDSFQTIILPTYGYDPGESETYPEGLDGFSDMIYVIKHRCEMELEPYNSWAGEWYYYYKNGCYGTVKGGNETNCIRPDHDHENLYVNFDPSGTGWTDYEKIYCSFSTGSGSYPNSSIPALCTDYDGDGIWTYDFNKSNFNFSKYGRYEIFFYTDTKKYTAPLLLQTGNLKDTIYATDELNYHDRPVIKWTNEIPLVIRPIESLKDVLSTYENENGVDVPTYRYYFLMPNGENGQKGDGNDEWINNYYGKYADSWYNENADRAGIYWWDQDILNPKYWPGYTMEQGDSDCVYYADVPQSIERITFNNALDGGSMYELDIYHQERQSYQSMCYPDPDYGSYYPLGAENFDNMIYVFNPSINSEAEMTYPIQFGGAWHYYYGNGCYGDTKDGDINDCIRDDHDHGLKKVKLQQFLDFCSITEADPYNYTGPLYYHYGDDENTPKWFLTKGDGGFSGYNYFYGVFGDYILYESADYSPAKFQYCIYVYEEDKFYTLEDAWNKGIEGLDEMIAQYFIPHNIGNIIGDCDFDNILSVLDATKIQMAEAGIIKLYDKMYSECIYGQELGCENDFDKDGVRSVLDATAIQMKIAKLD